MPQSGLGSMQWKSFGPTNLFGLGSIKKTATHTVAVCDNFDRASSP